MRPSPLNSRAGPYYTCGPAYPFEENRPTMGHSPICPSQATRRPGVGVKALPACGAEGALTLSPGLPSIMKGSFTPSDEWVWTPRTNNSYRFAKARELGSCVAF